MFVGITVCPLTLHHRSRPVPGTQHLGFPTALSSLHYVVESDSLPHTTRSIHWQELTEKC